MVTLLLKEDCMKIEIELTSKDLKQLIIDHLVNKIDINFKPEYLHIMVKSKQNYKSEWEEADFKATYSRSEL